MIGKISARAKQIRKKNPKIQWQTAIKKASLELKGTVIKPKKVGATLLLNKGETKRTKPKRVYRVNRKKDGTYTGTTKISGMQSIGRVRTTTRKKTTVASTIKKAKKMLLDEIGLLEAKKFATPLKRDKKKVAKKLAEKKSQFRRL